MSPIKQCGIMLDDRSEVITERMKENEQNNEQKEKLCKNK